MSFVHPDVPLLVPAWQREETFFLKKILTPVMCAQFGFLAFYPAAPREPLNLAVNLMPAALLMGYLAHVLYRAYKDGEIYPWGHNG